MTTTHDQTIARLGAQLARDPHDREARAEMLRVLGRSEAPRRDCYGSAISFVGEHTQGLWHARMAPRLVNVIEEVTGSVVRATVDGDAISCELITPPLSSYVLDFSEAGLMRVSYMPPIDLRGTSITTYQRGVATCDDPAEMDRRLTVAVNRLIIEAHS